MEATGRNMTANHFEEQPMRKATLAVVCALAWTASTNAQDSFEKVLDEMIPAFGKLNESLATIKDKKSFEVATPTLKTIADQMVLLKDRGKKLGEPKGKMKDELETKYKAKLEEAARKLATEMLRIKRLTDGEEFVKEISNMLSPLRDRK
jgi:hypothetical protein